MPATLSVEDRDYVASAIEYAERAVSDRHHARHGRWIRLAAQRFLGDLERAEDPECEFFFDEWHANNACDFLEKLPHVEGRWQTPYLQLHPAQIFFVAQLFGFRKRTAIEIEGWGAFHPRRFTSALYAVARKNGKSALSAAILLYCLCCEPEDGAQVISAATTYDQASIIFRIAKRMAEKTSELRDAFGLQTWAKTITRLETGAAFKAVHAKASTQDGLNPSHTALDEIHAHKSADLLNVLQSAAGARANPLWLFTTTEGYSNPGPWAEIRGFAFSLLKGGLGTTADHFLAVFFALDNEDKTAGIESDDEFDESKWVKANPLLDVNEHLFDAIRREAVEAKQMPSKLAEFRIKRLNRPASTAEGWIDLHKWMACAGEVDLDWLADYPCWGGLDLASTTDIAAFRLLWHVEGMWYTHGWRWVPEDSVAYRTERGTVPYAGWVNSGTLIQTPGNVTDYAVIEDQILQATERFQIENIAFDAWNATDLVSRLLDQGVPMIQFVQGPKSYHPAMQALERAYVSGHLAHGGDPVLAWCASNLVARHDVNLNMAPDRKRSADKIDDMVALLMAFGLGALATSDDNEALMSAIRNPIIL
ncbi:terminase large subunit [Orrella sp. 11846]|uniref:terminase large subunit n=1 Tax=Orrella sp. 11846 TaxID=3409913 RepID=UPI003B5A921C